ncbi:MFS transporter [Carboxylicivirga sp. RSCT41]|uniref:MFS transporter n=1 Tax=Carboxylicivirga agarovorans TaxID=3417570 RepID=UPI003D349F4B
MKKMTKTQKSVLLVATLTSFLGPFIISSVNIALPDIEHHFDIDAITLSWIIISYLLSSAIFLLPMGKWADIKGAKKIFKQGTIVFVLFTFLCAITNSSIILIIARFLQGVGAAMLMTTGPAILISEFPINQRGRVLGLNVAAVYIGLSVGPVVGGFVTYYIGWQGVFWISGILGLSVMLVAFLFLGKDENKSPQSRMDQWGVLIYMLALSCFVYGSSKITILQGQVLIIVGTLLIISFLIYQAKVSYPIFPIHLFKTNKLFAYSNIAALINYSATFAIVFLLSLYLQKIQHYSPKEAGSILIAQPIVMAFLSPLAGYLSDRLEPRILASCGMAICSLGLARLAFLTADTSTFTIIGTLGFIGLGFALFSSPNMNTIMSSIDKTKSGLASGMVATMRVLGQMASVTIASALFAIFFKNESIEGVADKLFIKGIHYAFLTFAFICGGGIYFSMSRGKMHNKTIPE